MEGQSNSLKIKLLRKIFKIETVEEIVQLIEQFATEDLKKETLTTVLRRLLKVSKKTVEEVMVPRIDMITVHEDMHAREVIETYKKYGYSRMPVISERSDRVKGILYIKELIRRFDEIDRLKAKDLAKKPNFIPDSQKVLEALNQFQKRHISIAMVVDEFGSVVGLVTLEDLLEEIVGEIWEEFDKEEKLIIPKGEGTFIISTRADLDEVSAALKVPLVAEDVHTLGGFIVTKLERVPNVGEEFKIKGLPLSFKVLEGTQQRVKKVLVKKLTAEKDEESHKD